jgi:hypothetical protein
MEAPDGPATEPDSPATVQDADVRKIYGLQTVRAELSEHLSLIARWFYSKPREGEILFRDGDWPYRRMLRACARLLAPPAEEKQAAEAGVTSPAAASQSTAQGAPPSPNDVPNDPSPPNEAPNEAKPPHT